MTVDLLWKAFLLGLLNAAPVGPVGLICLKKNMEGDRWCGLFAALGMAAAYGVIAFLVLFCLKWISNFLEIYGVPLQFSGGIALILMGWTGLKRNPSLETEAKCARRYLGEFSTTFAMTLFNPVPFATFTLIIATFKIVSGTLDFSCDLYFAFLVLTGTICFWIPVNQLLHVAKRHSPREWSRRINFGAANLMILFGLLVLVKGIMEMY